MRFNSPIDRNGATNPNVGTWPTTGAVKVNRFARNLTLDTPQN